MSEHPTIPSGNASQGATAPGEWPKISLVTPVFNSARYLEATIRSVLSQQYPNLEYVLVDGGSTDGSVDIIRKYEPQLHAWMSESDRGMYDAINKGFARSSGELMGWISATDMLHAGSLFVVGSVFRQFPGVDWITGRPTGFNDDGMAVEVLKLRQWSRMPFLAGANRYIQQESTFWRRSLWDQAGGRVDDSRRSASDFELWVRFFRYAKLYPVDALIGGFRSHPDSLGLQNLGECHRIQNEIIANELASMPGARGWKLFRALSTRVLNNQVLAKPWNKLVFSAVMKWSGGRAPIIRHRKERWVMEP
ncbi:MAG TPA: glycosyltransferase family 2 protein [Terriglobales bacterium]|nr:glycosyltransferase family 2 protein [Terriglobales bacterium]